eukprot:1332918-Rhodomonas_salina.1
MGDGLMGGGVSGSSSVPESESESKSESETETETETESFSFGPPPPMPKMDKDGGDMDDIDPMKVMMHDDGDGDGDDGGDDGDGNGDGGGNGDDVDSCHVVVVGLGLVMMMLPEPTGTLSRQYDLAPLRDAAQVAFIYAGNASYFGGNASIFAGDFALFLLMHPFMLAVQPFLEAMLTFLAWGADVHPDGARSQPGQLRYRPTRAIWAVRYWQHGATTTDQGKVSLSGTGVGNDGTRCHDARAEGGARSGYEHMQPPPGTSTICYAYPHTQYCDFICYAYHHRNFSTNTAVWLYQPSAPCMAPAAHLPPHTYACSQPAKVPETLKFCVENLKLECEI